MPQPPTPVEKVPVKKKVAKKDESSSDSSDDEEEMEATKTVTPAKVMY